MSKKYILVYMSWYISSQIRSTICSFKNRIVIFVVTWTSRSWPESSTQTRVSHPYIYWLFDLGSPNPKVAIRSVCACQLFPNFLNISNPEMRLGTYYSNSHIFVVDFYRMQLTNLCMEQSLSWVVVLLLNEETKKCHEWLLVNYRLSTFFQKDEFFFIVSSIGYFHSSDRGSFLVFYVVIVKSISKTL